MSPPSGAKSGLNACGNNTHPVRGSNRCAWQVTAPRGDHIDFLLVNPLRRAAASTARSLTVIAPRLFCHLSPPAVIVRLILFRFLLLLVQFRGEDFGTSGQHYQTSAGRDRSQDLRAGQRLHERQSQGTAPTHMWCYTPVRRIPEAFTHLAWAGGT